MSWKPIHGMSRTSRVYRIWQAMKDRCYREKNPSYKNYGGRGITVCDEWKDDSLAFINWAMANGYSDELTIEREDNDKGYSPDNCKWATRTEQARNVRTRSDSEHGIKGVHWDKRDGKWTAYITRNRKRIFIGNYNTPQEAIEARKQAEIDYWENNKEIPPKDRVRSTNTSGITGVSYSKKSGKWMAYIKSNRKHIHLGTYATIEEAAEARKQGELKYW